MKEAIVIALWLATFFGGWYVGDAVHAGRQARAANTATTQVVETAQQHIARSTQAGHRHERARVAVEAHFNRLEQEAAHEATDPVVDGSACELPAERLRRWAAANAGPAGAPAAEPDAPAAAASAAELGPHEGPGAEPPAGDAGVSPTGGADVRPAGGAGGEA